MEEHNYILDQLPYGPGFRFVENILEVDQQHIIGEYRFDPDAHFYRDHFPENPVTPGVILTECLAQIALVCQGIFLLSRQDKLNQVRFAFSESEMQFLLPVLPGEQVRVEGQVQYFRFNKLKTKAKMYNTKSELVCTGTLSGMIIQPNP